MITISLRWTTSIIMLVAIRMPASPVMNAIPRAVLKERLTIIIQLSRSQGFILQRFAVNVMPAVSRERQQIVLPAISRFIIRRPTPTTQRLIFQPAVSTVIPRQQAGNRQVLPCMMHSISPFIPASMQGPGPCVPNAIPIRPTINHSAASTAMITTRPRPTRSITVLEATVM